MIKRRRLMRSLARACNIASLMLAGALLLAMYLAYTNPLFDRPFTVFRSSLFFALSVFAALGAWLRPIQGSATSGTNRGWSGVAFVVVTGLAASAFFIWVAPALGDYIIAATILIATVVIAAMLWPFATEQAGEIG